MRHTGSLQLPRQQVEWELQPGPAFTLEDALVFTWEAGTAPHELLREAKAEGLPPALAQIPVIDLMDATLGECDFTWGRIYPSLESNPNAI